MFDIDAVDLGPRVISIRGRVGRELETDKCLVAFDVHTCSQFLLPPLTDRLWELAEVSPSLTYPIPHKWRTSAT